MRVSVLIPLYNGIEYLQEAVDSVKGQVYRDFECIVGVNGHGEDGGECFVQAKKIIASLYDDRFFIVNLPTAHGVHEAINGLVKRATSDWIAVLDADDSWHPMKLQCQMNSIREFPNIDFCGTWCSYFGEWSGGPNIPGGFVPNEAFRTGNPIIHSSIVMRKELADYQDENLCDYELWVRQAVANKVFYNVPLPLTNHRVYAQSYFNGTGKQKPELVRLKYYGHS